MINIFSDELEKTYTKKQDNSHIRKYAQYFTPFEIAVFMSKWIIGNSKCNLKILDPAFGLGVFSRAIYTLTQKNILLDAYDIDPQIVNGRPNDIDLLNDKISLNLHLQDYLFSSWSDKYDAVICNPPYFKFHDYESKNDVINIFQKNLNIKFSGFTNIYAFFLIKSLSQLKDNGRCAFIIPSEFLNSDYGKHVKDYLISEGSLKHIILFDTDVNVFSNALTTSSIFLFSKEKKEKQVEFHNIKSINELDIIDGKISVNLAHVNQNKHLLASLNPLIKWRSYYEVQHSHKFKNLIDFRSIAKVSRGIATGANDYFLFNIDKIKQTNIPIRYFEPVISKANNVKSHFFTQANFDYLSNTNREVYILNANDNDLAVSTVKDYIAYGEELEVNKKHLTSHRSPWFILENKKASPIWVSVFARGGLKFFRNEAGIKNLTTFHSIYLSSLAEQKIDILFAYLLTPISKLIFSENRRAYGGGLDKFEPNDLNNSKVVNIYAIPPNTELRILETYSDYRNSELIGEPDASLINELEDIFRAIIT